MLELIMHGFGSILNLQSLLIMTIGVFIGIIFGSVPGLDTAMAVALCLPVTYAMTPTNGIAMIIALFIGGVSGGLISATLLNIPGTAASFGTCLDGAPMAAKGEAGKALGIGITASFVGTIISALALIFIAPLLASFALKFGPVEYFSVAVFSLTIMSSLAGDSMIKGLISGLLGCLIATFGTAPIDYVPRFTFGSVNLESGFSMISVMTGSFAISEILKNIKASREMQNLTTRNGKIKGFGYKWQDLKGQGFNFIRSALIGLGIGILPGIGASTSNIVAYGAAKNGSKYPEKFGTGIVDGIVATETANNATVGGALIPLLTLGIPGDVGTALMLGGLMIHGIVPGPLLMQTNASLVYTIFAALIFATILMVILEYAGMRVFTRLLTMPKYYIMPAILILCCVGAYANSNRMFDVRWLVLFGLYGYVLKLFNYPLGPMIIGYIVGPIAEMNLRRALMLNNNSFLPFITRPLSAFFLLLAAYSIYRVTKKSVRQRKMQNTNLIDDGQSVG